MMFDICYICSLKYFNKLFLHLKILNQVKIRRYDTMATGAVYFHRFYMVQSFKNFPRWVGLY